MKTFKDLIQGDEVYLLDLREMCIKTFLIYKINPCGEERLDITLLEPQTNKFRNFLFRPEDHYRYNIFADKNEAFQILVKHADLRLEELANDINRKISIYEKIERTIQQYKNEIN